MLLQRALTASAASLLQRLSRHPVTRAAAGFAAITSIVKALAFVKEAVVASTFGVGAAMDSYLMALVVIGFPSGVLLNAAQTAFIREYVRIVEVKGEVAAGRFFRYAMVSVLLVLTLVLLGWLALLPRILTVVGHGLPAGERSLVGANVYQLIPYCYLNSINLLGYGVLQSRKRFTRAGVIPAATPICIMALVAAMGADLKMLIAALTLGTALETALIFLLTKNALGLLPQRGPREWHGLREFTWGTLILAPGMLLSGLSPVIEQTIASGLGQGTISALGYASKLPATLNSLLTVAVAVTILPYLTQRLLTGDAASVRRFFVRYSAVLMLFGMAIAAAAVLVSGPFVQVAFQRGHFTAENALLVTKLQRAYLWQLPGAMAGIAAIRFVIAQGRYRALTVGNLLMVPLTGALQWTLALAWGGAGLAFATSLGAALSAVVFFAIAMRGSAPPSA